jgi:segregation and condensation protein B
MSLKAKLEAVIYAAEEPVTLNQLAVLFADEALEWRAEQQKLAADAEASTAASGEEPLLLLTEDSEFLQLEPGAEPAADAATEASIEAPVDNSTGAPAAAETPVADPQSPSIEETSAEEPPAEPAPEPVSSESPDETEGSETPGLTAEETAKQAARQRDREVRLALRELLDELVEDYANDSSGIEIREIAGGFRMATKPEYHDSVRTFVKSLKPAMKLSLPALETLAVIAYKQPVTAPEVNEIRGVESSGVFGSLLARKLIATAGRKQVVGRPILYKTTKEFLLRFGLKDVTELPSMEEFEKMAATELEETEIADAELNATAAEETEQENSVESGDETDNAENAESPLAPDPAPVTAEPTAEAAPAEDANTALE